MRGYIAHTDAGWWRSFADAPAGVEVNFWRPGGRGFAALQPGGPFFFRLKSPVNRIGGFGLFSRYQPLPVWRAWEVFGTANGVDSETALLDRVRRLARRDVRPSDAIGCIVVGDCTFFAAEELVEVPGSFRPQNLSGSQIDMARGDGRVLWEQCLTRAAAQDPQAGWAAQAVERLRAGRPAVLVPRLGQGAFRLAVMDAYGGRCAVTGERSLPALESAHIRPWAQGGAHELANGLPLRRDVHRLFDLGYMSAAPDGRVLVSPRLRAEFANGRAYYALAGRGLLAPRVAQAAPARELLEWHSSVVFQSV
jgi:putative restriction endonuclease